MLRHSILQCNKLEASSPFLFTAFFRHIPPYNSQVSSSLPSSPSPAVPVAAALDTPVGPASLTLVVAPRLVAGLSGELTMLLTEPVGYRG